MEFSSEALKCRQEKVMNECDIHHHLKIAWISTEGNHSFKGKTVRAAPACRTP